MTNVGFIGAGNMGYAIIKGIAESELNDKVSIYAASTSIKLFAYDSDNEKVKRLTQFGVELCTSVSEVFKNCKYVVLAVKPQQLGDVLESVEHSFITNDTVIVSICAGITSEFIKSRTIHDAKVVLVMPNTPMLLGEGASALAKVEPTTDVEFDFVCKMFSTCGEIAAIPENKMKEIIPINGSSPAFIYLFAKAFIDYANSVGIDSDVSKNLFSQSLIGAAKMMTDSGYSIDELITMVSSKGGTTIAGLEKLRSGGLEETVLNCCDACTNRAYELSK